MSKFQDVEAPYLTLEPSAAPGTPAAGLVRYWHDLTDGVLKVIDEDGTIADVGGGGGGGGASFIGCKVHNSTAIALTTATITSLNFDTEDYDASGMHSTSSNTNRIVVPRTGVFRLIGSVRFAPSTSGDRLLGFTKNNTTVMDDGAQRATGAVGVGNDAFLTGTTDLLLASGDYVTLAAYQASGSNLNVSHASLSVYYLPGS